MPMTHVAVSRPACRRGGKISLVVPVYNEGKGLAALRDAHRRLLPAEPVRRETALERLDSALDTLEQRLQTQRA